MRAIPSSVSPRREMTAFEAASSARATFSRVAVRAVASGTVCERVAFE